MDVYAQIAQKIIEQQETIIGPIAIEQARRVDNLMINWPKEVRVSGDQSFVIDDLVHQYERLFGRLSVEVCKDATRKLLAQLPPDKQPETLRG